MLVQSSVAKTVMQGRKAVSVGVDMGSQLWVVTVVEYDSGRERCLRFSGDTYDQECYEVVKKYVDRGYDVHVVYEAGRSGFTPARVFESYCGATVTIIPVNKLKLVTSGKRAKTDRLDSRFLAGLDSRCMQDIPAVWVPSVEEECRRGALREKKRMERDIGRNNNRILAILERWPGRKSKTHLPAGKWMDRVSELRKLGIVPEIELLRIEAVVRELVTLEANLENWVAQLAQLEEAERRTAQAKGEQTVVDILRQYKGVGEEISRAVAWYVGDLRRFRNARKFASYLGLTPTPFSSCSSRREQGISKQGDPELRRLAVQLAWLWRQWQPGATLTKKWEPRLAPGRKKGERPRSRKTAAVALARQLMVALWRQVVHGIPIEGAEINCPLPQLT